MMREDKCKGYAQDTLQRVFNAGGQYLKILDALQILKNFSRIRDLYRIQYLH